MKRILFIIIAVMLAGCIKKAKDNFGNLHGAKWSGTYAVPILDLDLSLNDAVELVGNFAGAKPYSDGLIYLEYLNKEISKSGNEILPLPDQNHLYSDILTGPEISTLTGSNKVTISRDFSYPYAIPGIEIDSVLYLQGNLKLNFSNNYSHPGNATITLPELKLNGIPAKFTFSFTANQQNISKYFNLVGYNWNMSNGGAGFNFIKGQLDISYNNSGNGFGGGDNFKLEVTADHQVFNKVYGYFGNSNLLTAQDSLELGVFTSGLKTGNYSFSDPRFKLRVKNSTGIPLELKTNSLAASLNGSTTNISGYPPTKPIGTVTVAKIGNTYLDSVFLDKNNSNFKSVIDNKSHYILYNFDVSGNPGGKTGRNFLSFESNVTVDVITELPFFGTAVNIVVEDTSSFDLGLGKETDYIDWIVLRMTVDNEIPTEIGLQGYFMDSSNVVLDSLFKPYRNLVNAAKVDGSGSVVAPAADQYDITLDRPRITKIKNAKKIRIKAFMNTSMNAGISVPVKITRMQHLKLKMGIHAKLSANAKF